MKKQYCPKCGVKVYDNSKFCPSCGWQIAKNVVCETCGKELHPDTEICPNCNTEIEQTNTTEELESGKTLIESIESNNEIEDRTEEETIIQENQKSPEHENVVPGERKHNVLAYKGKIEVARLTMLLMGIIMLVQNILLIGFLSSTYTLKEAAVISKIYQNPIKTQKQEYRGFTERHYKNPDNNFDSRNREDKNNEKKFNPVIPSNIYKLLLLVIIIGLIQGAGFIYLSRYVHKNAFIAILVAFIFELTYGILKIVTMVFRAFQGININYSQFNKILSKGDIAILMVLQVIMLVIVTAVLIFVLFRGLKSAIELRKMENK